jgi:hypothetical protein
MMLRRIFEPKRNEVIGGWRKLNNEELHNLYSSSNVIRMIKSKRVRWLGHITPVGDKENAYSVLVGKPECRRPLEEHLDICSWEDNIKLDLRDI